jgi:cobalt transporter subunit CbtA
MTVVLLSGALAGFALFVAQHLAVVPLIETAETYEAAAQQAMPGMAHEDEGWQPSDGIKRTSFTALSTMLSGIGFAAVLIGGAALSGRALDTRRGMLWGLAGFVCFVLAPALGLPPKPPGAAVADLYARQLWWLGTAAATAAGLWLMANREHGWVPRIAGAALLLLPHLVGAPSASEPSAVPEELMREFAIVSVATTALFWLLLGAIGGFLYGRVVTPSVAKTNPTLPLTT